MRIAGSELIRECFTFCRTHEGEFECLMGNTFLATSTVLALATATAAESADAPAASGDQLEEIVITAQKRPEKLQDVPVAAQVVSSQALANADVADLSDLNKLVPSVELNGTINGRVPTGVRGISSVSNEQTWGSPSGVAITIDGVPVPSDSFDANNVAGVQSVEVLLGPQSTLGGRTAASGLINFTTRGPSSTLQGSATTTVTDDGEYRVEGFLSGPRLSIAWKAVSRPTNSRRRSTRSRISTQATRPRRMSQDLASNCCSMLPTTWT